ncbi:MAG: YggT family protein [Alphaproteobacteria bacterium]|nr:YggT family protein [Alphaproteobacteria bacterium]MCL2505096.1 YggT family protein [Alphaproteobacteria bacterium]
MSIVSAFFLSILQLLLLILDLYVWVIIVGVILSWLIQFGVVNAYNRVVSAVILAISRITEPVLQPIRRVLPNTGTIDFSPLVLIFIIYFIKLFLGNLFVRL